MITDDGSENHYAIKYYFPEYKHYWVCCAAHALQNVFKDISNGLPDYFGKCEKKAWTLSAVELIMSWIRHNQSLLEHHVKDVISDHDAWCLPMLKTRRTTSMYSAPCIMWTLKQPAQVQIHDG